jgi:hypothetical protein
MMSTNNVARAIAELHGIPLARAQRIALAVAHRRGAATGAPNSHRHSIIARAHRPPELHPCARARHLRSLYDPHPRGTPHCRPRNRACSLVSSPAGDVR